MTITIYTHSPRNLRATCVLTNKCGTVPVPVPAVTAAPNNPVAQSTGQLCGPQWTYPTTTKADEGEHAMGVHESPQSASKDVEAAEALEHEAQTSVLQILALQLQPPVCVVAIVARRRRQLTNDQQQSAREQVGALPHAVTAILAFMNYGRAPFWTIPRVCKGDLRPLLLRLARRESANRNTHHRAHLFSDRLVYAVRNGNMDIV